MKLQGRNMVQKSPAPLPTVNVHVGHGNVGRVLIMAAMMAQQHTHTLHGYRQESDGVKRKCYIHVAACAQSAACAALQEPERVP